MVLNVGVSDDGLLSTIISVVKNKNRDESRYKNQTLATNNRKKKIVARTVFTFLIDIQKINSHKTPSNR